MTEDGEEVMIKKEDRQALVQTSMLRRAPCDYEQEITNRTRLLAAKDFGCSVAGRR